MLLRPLFETIHSHFSTILQSTVPVATGMLSGSVTVAILSYGTLVAAYVVRGYVKRSLIRSNFNELLRAHTDLQVPIEDVCELWTVAAASVENGPQPPATSGSPPPREDE